MTAPRRRVRLRVEGTVQGVGFRPHVHRLATDLGLAGFVLNDAAGVVVEVESDPAAVDRFLERLGAEAPALARIERVLPQELPAVGDRGFAILRSDDAGDVSAAVPADAATCADCLRELRDRADRRYRHPFITCTACGPRYTIVTGVPYDRARTTMAAFPMCDACRAEYEDPADRRFHAEPIACPDCGPRLSLPVEDVVTALLDGRIAAVKGIGGYHLACRADDEAVVARLRARKRREEKPFAVMAPDLTAAERLVDLTGAERALLGGRERPIVLARRRPDAAVAPSVAPRSADVGVMLPYSPLHHLLLGDAGVPLVMTSGNRSDEPIAHDDADAAERLAGIADLILAHDRPIATRVDDSVVRAIPGRAPLVMRRSRGWAPGALALPVPAPRHLLACGAELKSTACVAKDGRAWVGHHIGDLEDWETLRAYRESVDHLERLFAVAPEVVAHDLHPGYLSTAYALERDGVRTLAVQHHHAHLAACLAEHGETGPAVGAILDGTGAGTDGTVWGGEILVGDLRGFRRVAHLHPVRLPGGEAAHPGALADGVRVAGRGHRGRCAGRPAGTRGAARPGGVARGRAARPQRALPHHDQRRAPARRGRGALRAAGPRDLRGSGRDRAGGGVRPGRGRRVRVGRPRPAPGGRPRRGGARGGRPRRRRGGAVPRGVRGSRGRGVPGRRRRGRPGSRGPERRRLPEPAAARRGRGPPGGRRPAGARAGAAAPQRRRHQLRPGGRRGRRGLT